MDVLHDNSYRKWLKISQEYAVPAYVLQYEPLSKEAAAAMEAGLFADKFGRTFPIDSPANTWLSAAYLKEAAGDLRRDEFAYLRTRIKRAGAIHEIESDVNAVLDKEAEVAVNPEVLDENYCHLVKDATGSVVAREYPVFDARGAEKASEYFDKYRHRYPIATRREIATRILNKCAEHSTNPWGSTLREAGLGAPYLPTIMHELLERAKMTKDAESAMVFANLNEALNAAGAEDLLASMDKLAETIDALDRLNGMTEHYNVRLLGPADVVFSMTLKQAHAFVDDSVTLNKYTFSATKLAELDPNSLDIFGDTGEGSFISTVTGTDGKLSPEKLATVIPTLPRPDKILLEEHLLSACS